MSESIWNDATDAMVTLFAAQMGAGSAYTTLKATYIDAVIGFDISDWDDWATDGKLPAVIVQGQNSKPVEREHGTAFSSPRSIAKDYPYLVLAIVEGFRPDAERNARVLIKRIEKVVLTAKTLTAAGNQPIIDASGEQIERMSLDGIAGVRTFRKADPDGYWYAVGAVGLIVRTQT